MIHQATEQSQGFGLFIRSRVGLDRNAAKEIFSEYLAVGTHTVNRILYINTIIAELSSRLYEQPFSNIAQGPKTLFSEAEVDKICNLLLDLIRLRAAPVRAA